MKLRPIEQAFINEYLKNGCNATQAYLSVKPKCKYESARVISTRMLAKVTVKEAIEQAMEKTCMSNVASREYLIQETHETVQEAKKEKCYGAAIKGIELKGKLNRLFDREQPDMAGYQVLMQQLIINTTDKADHSGDVIDIVREEIDGEGRD